MPYDSSDFPPSILLLKMSNIHRSYFTVLRRLIQVVACINSSPLAVQYSVGWIYHNLLNSSPVKRHPNCFQLFTIMNKAAINTCVQVFCVNISLYFSRINTQVHNCWVVCQLQVQFFLKLVSSVTDLVFKKLPDRFLK